MKGSLKTKFEKKVCEDIDKKLEKIAEDTAKEILNIRKGVGPSKVYLYGTKQEYLTDLLVKLGLKFKGYEEKIGEDLDIEIFTGFGNGYSIDVGYYLDVNHSKV